MDRREIVSRKPILVVAIAAALGVLSTLMYGWLGSDPPIETGHRAPPEIGLSSALPPLEREVRETGRIPSQEDSVRFRVIDELETPVAGAQLSIANESAPWNREIAIAVLGATDGAGRLEVPYSRIEAAPAGSLTIYHDAYSAQSLEPPIALDHENVITLRRGHRLSIRCEDLSGKPLPGVRILASSRALSTAGELSEGEIRQQGIHVAESDGEGRAAIEGIARGRYQLRATSPGRDVVSKPTIVVAGVPGPEPLISFAEVVCGRVRVLGDAVVTFSWRGDGTLLHEKPGTYELRRVREELKAAFPEDLVFVGLNSGSEGEPVAIDVEVLLQDHGRRELQVSLASSRDGCSETLLDVTNDPVDEVPCVSTQVVILSPSGNPVEVPHLVLESGRRGQGMAIMITPGKEKCLPPGEYTVSTYESFLDASLSPNSIVVSAETPRHEIRLLAEVMPYRVRLVDEGGENIPGGFLKIDAQGKHDMVQSLMIDRLILWLPSGTVTIKASAFGYQETDWTGHVGNGPIRAGGEITIVLPRN